MVELKLRLDPQTELVLKDLEHDLPRLGMKADRKTIVEALIFGATSPQLYGMIQNFVRTTHAADEGQLRLPR